MLSALQRVWSDRRVRLTLMTIVVGVTLFELYRAVPDWGAAARAASQADGGWLATAGALILVGGYAAMQSWVSILTPVVRRTTAWGAVFFVGQLGKYMPGSVWAALFQARMGSRLGGRPRSLFVGFVVTFAVSVTCAILVGTSTAQAIWGLVPALLLALGCLLVLVAGVTLPVVDRLGARWLEVPNARRNVAKSIPWSVAGWLLVGLHLAALTIAVGAPVGPALLWAVPAAALAVGGGSIVVFAPGGIGVRELILLSALSHVLPPAKAAAVVVLSRLIYVCGDVVLAGISFASSRSEMKEATA